MVEDETKEAAEIEMKYRFGYHMTITCTATIIPLISFVTFVVAKQAEIRSSSGTNGMRACHGET
jgi:hypothetical protein